MRTFPHLTHFRHIIADMASARREAFACRTHRLFGSSDSRDYDLERVGHDLLCVQAHAR